MCLGIVLAVGTCRFERREMAPADELPITRGVDPSLSLGFPICHPAGFCSGPRLRCHFIAKTALHRLALQRYQLSRCDQVASLSFVIVVRRALLWNPTIKPHSNLSRIGHLFTEHMDSCEKKWLPKAHTRSNLSRIGHLSREHMDSSCDQEKKWHRNQPKKQCLPKPHSNLSRG